MSLTEVADALVDTLPSPNPAQSSGSSPPRVVRLGLAGLGPVGRGLLDLLETKSRAIAERHGLRFDVARILVRDASRPRVAPRAALLTDDPRAFLAPGVDAVVEAIGAVGPAYELARAALRGGRAVVTANKALAAERGEELAAIARESGAAFRFEASVAAGLPLLSVIERSLGTTTIARVTGILNATSNCVLSEMSRRSQTLLSRGSGTLAESLARARARGVAEADASLDVSGRDAAAKLAVLARAAARRPIETTLEVEGIDGVTAADVAAAGALAYRLKPIARAVIAGGVARGFVAPALVSLGDPLAFVEDEANAVRLEGDVIESVFLAGPGAGPRPTAASIVDDLVAIARGGPEPARVARDDGAPPDFPPERRVRLATGRAYRVVEIGGRS